MSTLSTGRVDFHLHSYASNVTDYYAANTFSIPESYSDPVETYKLLKARGMDMVTLTDHNSIDGVREILDAGYSDVFISAEMTATFPEDGCNIHVTVANMTEAQFAEVDRLRGNVYEMVAYVDEQVAGEAHSAVGNKLAYFMTHPLMSTQNRPYGREGSLYAEHVEKALLMFNTIEVQNGTRTRHVNEFTLRLIESLDRETIERLANKHGMEPKGATPWLKSIIAGSDDHCGINPGHTWTEFCYEGERPTPNAVVESIRRRETRAAGAHGGPVQLAHAMVKLLYDGNKQNAPVEHGRGGVGMGRSINSLLRIVFDGDSLKPHQKLGFKVRAVFQGLVSDRWSRSRRDLPFERILGIEARALLSDPHCTDRLERIEKTDDKIFFVVSHLTNRIFAHYVRRMSSNDSLNLVRLVKEVIGAVTSNLFVSLPYLLSYFHQNSDKALLRDVRKRFDMSESKKVVLITDTFFEINGVARTIRRMIDEAERRDINFRVVTCLSSEEEVEVLADPDIERLVDRGQLKIFRSIVTRDFPEYDDLQIRFPPLLELLQYMQEEGFTKVQISTPGPVGAMGLMAAKILQIETSSTYHTSFPEYVEDYTQDISLEALTWKYMIWFYHAVDEVVVPSRFIAHLLHKRGLRNRKILILDRWVDLQRFHPSRRSDAFWERRGLEHADGLCKFVYVGRLGVEKNLAVLVEAYRRLRDTHENAHLVIIGDGPYREELERQMEGLPATVVGFLEGRQLSQAIASCDAKVFPSTTDTWGNAPLEAQASGLPVIVTDKGGPQELIAEGESGFVVPGRNVEALRAAMARLMDPATRARMGAAARNHVEVNRVDEPFCAIFDSDAYRARLAEARREPVLTILPEPLENPRLIAKEDHGRSRILNL